jgi:hypothetical protein
MRPAESALVSEIRAWVYDEGRPFANRPGDPAPVARAAPMGRPPD